MGLVEFLSACKEGFEEEEEYEQSPAKGYVVTSLFAVVIYIVLIGLFGKYLWNEYLTKFVTVVKPVNGAMDIIALSVLLSLLYG